MSEPTGTDFPLIIDRIVAHAVRTKLPRVAYSAKGPVTSTEMLIVEVTTRDGITGLGEGFSRVGSRSHALFVDDVLSPLLVGLDARDRRGLWKKMRAAISGRPGGQIVEIIAAIDMALWDIVGKSLGQPVHRLLGGMGRDKVRSYGSSLTWSDDARAEEDIAHMLDAGFREIKLKIGPPYERAIDRIRFVRKAVGGSVRLYADANWGFSLAEALRVGQAMIDEGYEFFEEPLVSHDRVGYLRLSQALPLQLAAGEADYVAGDALERMADRSVGIIQPDVARTGGITETWRIAELAAVFHTGFAPHMGASGRICMAASIHLAAAAESFVTIETMAFDNPLRDELCFPAVGDRSLLVDGMIPVPTAPGLGVELNRDALKHFAIN